MGSGTRVGAITDRTSGVEAKSAKMTVGLGRRRRSRKRKIKGAVETVDVTVEGISS